MNIENPVTSLGDRAKDLEKDIKDKDTLIGDLFDKMSEKAAAATLKLQKGENADDDIDRCKAICDTVRVETLDQAARRLILKGQTSLEIMRLLAVNPTVSVYQVSVHKRGTKDSGPWVELKTVDARIQPHKVNRMSTKYGMSGIGNDVNWTAYVDKCRGLLTARLAYLYAPSEEEGLKAQSDVLMNIGMSNMACKLALGGVPVSAKDTGRALKRTVKAMLGEITLKRGCDQFILDGLTIYRSNRVREVRIISSRDFACLLLDAVNVSVTENNFKLNYNTRKPDGNVPVITKWPEELEKAAAPQASAPSADADSTKENKPA